MERNNTLHDNYSMMCSYNPEYKDNKRDKDTRDKRETEHESQSRGISFLQQGNGITLGTDGASNPNITWFKCGRKENHANMCPGINSADFKTLQIQESNNKDRDVHFVFTQKNLRDISDMWVLIDRQCTTYIFWNHKLLRNIRNAPETMTLVTNSGFMKSNMKGNIINFGMVWFNENSLVNIISLAEVPKHCRVTMDTDVEPVIIVHQKSEPKMKFIDFDTGLYYFDTADRKNNDTKFDVKNYCFFETVANNKTMFTNRQVRQA